MNFSQYDGNDYYRPYAFFELPGFALAYALILFVLCPIGVFGNAMTIFLLLWDKRFSQTRNLFLVSLSIADMLVSASSNPASVMGLLLGKENTEGNKVICTFTAVICVPSCVASLYTMVGVAVSRYYYITKYNIYVKYFTKSCVTLYILFIWCVAFMVHLPNHLGWGEVHYSTVLRYCTADTELLSYLLFYATILFTSIVLSFVYYAKLYLVLRQTNLARKMIVGGKTAMDISKKGLRHETMMIKTTFKMFLFFFVCWAPLSVLFFARFIYLSPLWVYLFAEMLAHGNSTVNFLLYFISNEDFDKSFKKFFRIFIRRRTVVSVITPTNAKTVIR